MRAGMFTKLATATTLTLSIFCAATAFADPPRAGAPVGTGNFRRAEVLSASGAAGLAGPGTWAFPQVRGISRVGQVPAGVRVMAVTVIGDPRAKVTLVRVPTDPSQPVARLTTAQANKMGFVTQAQAKKIAEHAASDGAFAAPGKIRVEANGVSNRGNSYSFTQTTPLGYATKSGDATVKSVWRTVTFDGKGESATGDWGPPKTRPANPAPNE